MLSSRFGRAAALIALYWACYGIASQIIEPFSWFGSPLLQNLGLWGHALLLITPLVLVTFLFLVPSQLEARRLKRYLGVDSVSTGSGRIEAFQQIVERSKHRTIFVGLAMSNLAKYARRTLTERASQVPIDLLMLDPDFLDRNPALADKLQEFLDIPDFAIMVRRSFDALRDFAQAWNKNPENRHKIGLKVYETIPTMSMVMIDPEDDTGEIIIEFFLYQSGEYRPRFHLLKTESDQSLFNRVREEFVRLWGSARRVV